MDRDGWRGTGVGVGDRDGCVLIFVFGTKMWIGWNDVELVLMWGIEIGVCLSFLLGLERG